MMTPANEASETAKDLVERLRKEAQDHRDNRCSAPRHRARLYDRAAAEIERLQASLANVTEEAAEEKRKMHRRAQRAEGKLQRAQTWIDMRREGENRRSPYVRREMEHFYLRHILAELARPAAAIRAAAQKEGG